MRTRRGHSRSGSRRFAATLLFQFRVVIRGDSGKRRVCEKRIINFVAQGARRALSTARKAGRAAEYRYRNLSGYQVRFEFVGLLDLMELGVECGPDEVWYDIITMVRPMERRRKLIPRAPKLNAIRSLRRARPNKRLQLTKAHERLF
jgi:uncharacterized protein DUF4288